MGVPLCLPPPTLPCCSCSAGLIGTLKLAAAPSPSPSATQLPLSGARRRCAGVAQAAGDGGDGEAGKSGAAAFFEEDRVVEDMDEYLDYLSLEYDSVWDTKPVWCQPWTILLSGTVAAACSWVVLQSIVITAGVSFVICAWWHTPR
ncbi:uncharacterized protein LOC133893851 isoform X5 [Phragmites australis]|uniref:uncharacterized protein LOC133893851 isoform X5 n=1 Tax=Phragmites australis TaxID=29695 RepID=UPI002D7851AC|nr:uncharacterized protein LOC133893851 isoform X5 [Phragmites australis]